MSSAARHALIALAAYFALAAALLWPAPFGGEVLSACAPFVARGPFPPEVRAAAPPGTPILSDAMQTFEPWLLYAADAFARTGRIPLWKDSNFCGAPLLGNAQSALFWPPNLVAMLLGAPPDSLAWIALLKLTVAGLGAFLLARHLGLSLLGAFLAGAVFELGGFQVVYLAFPLSNVSVLLPWLLLCADRCALQPTGRRVAALAAVAALQHLGGHPETAFHGQLAAALLVLVRAASVTGGLRPALASRALWRPAAGFALGALAAAVQILPFLEYARQSEALHERSLERWSFASIVPGPESLLVPFALLAALVAARRLARSAGRLLPSALGLFAACAALFISARRDGLEYDPVILLAPDWLGSHDTFRGYGNYVLANGGYAGAAVVLAIFALLAGARRGGAGGAVDALRGVRRVAGAVLVLALLLAHDVPVLSGLLESLPGFSISVNVRLDVLALLATAVLAGMGLQRLGASTAAAGASALGEGGDAARDGRRLRARFLLATSALVLAALVGYVVSVARGHNQPKELLAAVREARPMAAASLAAGEAGAPAGGPRDAVGWIAPGSAADHAVLLFGRGRAWPVTLIPVPDELRAGTPALSAHNGPAYAYRTQVPADVLPPGEPYRVLCTGADGATALTPLLDVPPGPPRWLLRAAAPEGPKSRGEIAFFVLAVVLVAVGCTARGAALALVRGALVVACVASLLFFGRGFPPTVARAQFYPRSPFLEALARLRPDGRHLTFQSAGLQMNAETGAAYRLMEPVGYDAVSPLSVSRLLRAATDDSSMASAQWKLPVRRDVDRRLLGLMAVEQFAHAASDPLAGELSFESEPELQLTANEQYLPRARVVPDAVVEPDDARALDRLRDASFDPSTTVVLAQAPTDSIAERPAGPPAPARITADEGDRLVVDVTGSAGGWLVLADTAFPGWEASVDGAARDVLRANVAFRAVPLRAGDRVVEFAYRPASFRIGLLLSIIAVVVLALLARPRRRATV